VPAYKTCAACPLIVKLTGYVVNLSNGLAYRTTSLTGAGVHIPIPVE
jgi:hypothetical protein